MKQFFITTLFFATMMVVQAQDIELSKTAIDFGEIPLKPKSERSVMLYNRTKSPVVINAVTVDCNCTKVQWSKKPILGGDSTHLRVIYTPTETGVFYKKIKIVTSGDDVTLTIRGSSVAR